MDSEALKVLKPGDEEGAAEFSAADALGDTDRAEGSRLGAEVFFPDVSGGWNQSGVKALGVGEAFNEFTLPEDNDVFIFSPISALFDDCVVVPSSGKFTEKKFFEGLHVCIGSGFDIKIGVVKGGEPFGVDGEVAEVALKVVGGVSIALEPERFEEVDEFGAFGGDAGEHVALVLTEHDWLGLGDMGKEVFEESFAVFKFCVGELADVDTVEVGFSEEDAVGVGFGRDVGLRARHVCEGEGKIGEERFVDQLGAENLFGDTVFRGIGCVPDGFDIEFEIGVEGDDFAQETASLLGSVKWKACLTAVWVSWRRSRTVRSSW